MSDLSDEAKEDVLGQGIDLRLFLGKLKALGIFIGAIYVYLAKKIIRNKHR